MRKTQSVTTLTCDRCKREVDFLNILWIGTDIYSTYCNHETKAELCNDCWAQFEVFLGEKSQ